ELIDEVLTIAGRRLAPSVQLVADPALERTATERQTDGRMVLIGGPGQGKTTAGQFICQLFRTTLLRSRDPSSITPEARTTMEAMASQCEEDGIPLPTVHRFPIRVPLTELSECLASEERPNSLLGFMVERICDRVDRKLPADAFKKWLAHYPWLLVLDGLDEVPASSNRADVLAAIRDFWVDVTQRDTDVLVLATTRPQGYSEDFSPDTYRHMTLAPLSAKRGLHYGRRLAHARHGGDHARRDKIVARLERAAANPATAKLMTSPLQVTIMATLVNRGGQPPQERWKLFSEYYGVIYQREVEREIPAADVLRDHQPDIDAIHRRLAMILQVEAEHTRHAEARMSSERFATIVRQRLGEEGYEGDALCALEEQIISAAADRLVFIVGLEVDRVGFEIRSLQEFMAAEALMDGEEKCITDRLRSIAGVTSWRNVFLFAAGKCFVRRQHLRDTIYTICGELNDSVCDPLAPVALPGSVLATDMLKDGFTRNQPTHSRLLAKEALRLLENHEAEDELCDAYYPTLEKTYREALEKGLLAGSKSRKRCVATLLEASKQGIEWAEEVLDAHITPDGPGLIEILETGVDGMTPWALGRLDAHIENLTFSQILDHRGTLRGAGRKGPVFTVIQRLTASRRGPSFTIDAQLNDPEVEFSVGSLAPFEQPWRGSGPGTPHGERVIERWPAMAALVAFSANPRAFQLAEQLRRIAEEVPPSEWESIEALAPWPLAAALADADEDRARLLKLAALAEDGALGDASSWMDAETRWSNKGIGSTDIDHVPLHGASIDHAIDVRGFPFKVALWSSPLGGGSPTVDSLFEWLERIKNPAGRRVVIRWIASITENMLRARTEKRPAAQELALAVDETLGATLGTYPFELIANLDWSGGHSPEKAHLLKMIGSTIGRLEAEPDEYVSFEEPSVQEMLDIWKAEQSPGLYRILAVGLPHGSELCETLLAEASSELVAGNPGATGVLMLKAQGEAGVQEAMDRLAVAAKDGPGWLFTAIESINEAQGEARFSDEAFEAVLGRAWEIAVAEMYAVRHRDLFERIIDLAEELVNRRATQLRDREVWKSLKLFELPPPERARTEPEEDPGLQW
ncbi:MAG TPA: hypothetical protein VNO20_07200, partial [Solirubrobacterales bacterium]|nr:hypothetical protein [Solirubrobacterales bacterium]